MSKKCLISGISGKKIWMNGYGEDKAQSVAAVAGIPACIISGQKLFAADTATVMVIEWRLFGDIWIGYDMLFATW